MNRYVFAMALVLITGCAGSATQLVLRPLRMADASTRDVLSMRYTDEAAVITVTHRSGVGRAELQRTRGKWPRRVMVRLEKFARVEDFEVMTLDARGYVVVRAWPGHGITVEPRARGGGYDVAIPEAVLNPRATRVRLQWRETVER